MDVELKKERYSAVIGDRDEIKLRGVLDESSDLRQTKDLISEVFKRNPAKPIEIDLDGLTSGSWNGFLALDKLMSEIPCEYYIRNIKMNIYRYIALLPNLKKATVGEVEIEIINVKTGEKKAHNARLDLLQQTFSEKSSGAGFVRADDHHEIVGASDYLFRSQQSSDSHDGFVFWYNYLSFFTVAMSLAEDLERSVSNSLHRMGVELSLEYQSVKSALLNAGLPCPPNLQKAEDEAMALATSVKKPESIFSTLSSSIQSAVEEAMRIQGMLQIAFQKPDVSSDLRKSLKLLLDLKAHLFDCAVKAEKGGLAALDLLHTSPTKKDLDDSLINIPHLSGDALANFRNALSIMDPLSEDDWEETLPFVEERRDGIVKMLDDVQVLSQSFDLLRQILEHRVLELSEIADFLKNEETVENVRGFKEGFYDLIRRKIVTDQEKLSVEVFLKGVGAAKEDTQKPGDVLLF